MTATVSDALARLAAAHGVATRYEGSDRVEVEVDPAIVVAVLARIGVDASTPESIEAAAADIEEQDAVLPGTIAVVSGQRRDLPGNGTLHLEDGRTVEVAGELPADLPLGYHWLAVDDREVTVIVAPERLPEVPRTWGWMLQLYALHSSGSWGMGDYADLAEFARRSADQGAGVLLVNPVQAFVPSTPLQRSPYSPASRRFASPLYLSVTATDAFRAADEETRAAALALAPDPVEADSLVDHDAVWAAKRAALELLWEATGRDVEQHEPSDDLLVFATYAALAERYGADWRTWPEPLHDPHGDAVAAARADLADRIAFHTWLQDLCRDQLDTARAAATAMPVGIVHDLPVGVDPGGADAWAQQDVLASDVRVGCPADAFNPLGQDWGLPPWRPDRLAATGYAPFRDVVRSVLRHADGIRIDHVAGLWRLWWIPPGEPAHRGTYVHYDAGVMLAIVCLEALRAGAIAVGEDLGTVEETVTRTLHERGLLSSSVLWFERDWDEPGHPHIPPRQWEPESMASISTHDLPTVAGWLTDERVHVQARLGLIDDPDGALAQAADDRRALHDLLDAEDIDTSDPAVALHAVIAPAASRLVLSSPADAVGQVDQPNLPGTVDEYPNWRIRLPVDLDAFFTDERVLAATAPLRSARPRRQIPTSTYRLQLRPEFGFVAARELVDYLQRLGVGAVYLSPVLDATPGSTHGYDVTDPTRLRPELGGADGFSELTRAAQEAGLGVVVDIVPNHMSIEVPRANPWWWSVLKEGRDSPYAHHFDIDWWRERLLLPVLGDDTDVERLEVDGDMLAYHDHRFPIDAATVPLLDELTPQQAHDRQHYELVGWRRGNTELGYRRFFDIATLAAVRVERPDVFADAHREVLRWVRDGRVTGLRIDHPDGLSDPGTYLRRLRDQAPDAWIVVEKILHPGEQLPAAWPVDGTTGYDALREVSGVLLDPGGESAFDALAAQRGAPTDYAAVEEDARRMVTDRLLVAEVRRIAGLVDGVGEAEARAAVAETMVAFRVYRSYLPDGADEWAAAVARARSRRPDLAAALDALDAQVTGDPHGELATRIQQTSGMVVAKGTEDTAFYRYTRFAALNEVGGAPDEWGVDRATFHQRAAERAARTPHSMTTLTTHDTKRSEDTRARMLVLAELADEVTATLARWSERCGLSEPSLDLLAWQTLLGAWPISDERLAGYLLKAAKEGKVRTTWTEPDEEFEAEVAAWPALVRDVLGPEVDALAARLDAPGRVVALTQKLVQLTMPGVPDVYQGTELEDLSLVDPDNRRPVDYGLRRTLLDRLEDGWLPEVDGTGVATLHVVRRALRLRRDRPGLFDGHRPVAASDDPGGHALAFARSPDLVVVGTRLPVGLERRGGWGDAALPLADGRWTDALTGAVHRGGPAPVSALLATYPVALLVRERRA